jgi:hypothetical protein
MLTRISPRYLRTMANGGRNLVREIEQRMQSVAEMSASEPKFSIETKDLIEIYGPRIALNLPGNLSVPDFERPAKRLAQLVLGKSRGA